MSLKKNQIGTITKDLKTISINQSMKNDSFIQDSMEADSKIAYIMYHFLKGNTDKLPNYDSLQQTINEAKSFTISVACGLYIDKDLEITIEEPISENKTRIDKITQNDHIAIMIGKGVEPINVEKYPKFSQEKISAMQKYISNFYTNEEEYHKSKTIK